MDVASHLCSSLQLINKINSLSVEKLGRYKYPFTVDVCAHYASVTPEEAIETTARNFRYHGISSEDIERLNRMALLFKNQLYEEDWAVYSLPLLWVTSKDKL